MNFRSVRTELRKMGRKNLLNTLMNQKESKCLLNGLCSLHFDYKGYSFCLSEILGEGCESERLRKLEKQACEREETQLPQENVKAPLFDDMETSSYNLIEKENS
ncbi:MAG TPA: hypothetical protein VEM15_00025 [Thermodesulfobacteriota bacterium]|nr:hypothetical protein [Thermodesulfobacteriota bacterium]